MKKKKQMVFCANRSLNERESEKKRTDEKKCRMKMKAKKQKND